MNVTEATKLILVYTIPCVVVGWVVIGLFVWLPLWWVVTKYLPDKPKTRTEIVVNRIPLKTIGTYIMSYDAKQGEGNDPSLGNVKKKGKSCESGKGKYP